MSPYVQIGATCFGGSFFNVLISGRWEAYKERKSREPIPLKINRKGVHVPWGTVQKIERALNWLFCIWLAYMAVLLIAVVYTRLIE